MQFVCWILPWSYAAVRKSKPCMNHSTRKKRFPLANGRLILNSYDEDSVENNKRDMVQYSYYLPQGNGGSLQSESSTCSYNWRPFLRNVVLAKPWSKSKVELSSIAFTKHKIHAQHRKSHNQHFKIRFQHPLLQNRHKRHKIKSQVR